MPAEKFAVPGLAGTFCGWIFWKIIDLLFTVVPADTIDNSFPGKAKKSCYLEPLTGRSVLGAISDG